MVSAIGKAVPMWVIGTEICEALGVDPNRIRSLNLRINPDEGAVFEMEGFLTDEVGKKLETIMTQYRLVPRALVDVPENGREVSDDG